MITPHLRCFRILSEGLGGGPRLSKLRLKDSELKKETGDKTLRWKNAGASIVASSRSMVASVLPGRLYRRTSRAIRVRNTDKCGCQLRWRDSSKYWGGVYLPLFVRAIFRHPVMLFDLRETSEGIRSYNHPGS